MQLSHLHTGNPPMNLFTKESLDKQRTAFKFELPVWKLLPYQRYLMSSLQFQIFSQLFSCRSQSMQLWHLHTGKPPLSCLPKKVLTSKEVHLNLLFESFFPRPGLPAVAFGFSTVSNILLPAHSACSFHLWARITIELSVLQLFPYQQYLIGSP